MTRSTPRLRCCSATARSGWCRARRCRGCPSRASRAGSSEPEVQAEPDEAAMPNLLSSSRIASPSMNSKAMLLVLGRRLVRVAGDEGARHGGEDAGLQLVAQALHFGVLEVHVLHGLFAGLAERDDRGGVFGAGAAAALLVAAAQQRAEACRALQIEHADALGRMQLVARTATACRSWCSSGRSAPCPPPAPRRCGTCTPAACASSAICSTGNSVPVSLLAHITETMATLSAEQPLVFVHVEAALGVHRGSGRCSLPSPDIRTGTGPPGARPRW
jgi:hypothetical protein